MSVSVALVVKLVSKPETSAEVAQFLTGALDLANDEVGTPVWFGGTELTRRRFGSSMPFQAMASVRLICRDRSPLP